MYIDLPNKESGARSMTCKNIEIGYGGVKRVSVGEGLPLAFFGGPCAIESKDHACLLYTSPSPRDAEESRMPSSA